MGGWIGTGVDSSSSSPVYTFQAELGHRKSAQRRAAQRSSELSRGSGLLNDCRSRAPARRAPYAKNTWAAKILCLRSPHPVSIWLAAYRLCTVLYGRVACMTEKMALLLHLNEPSIFPSSHLPPKCGSSCSKQPRTWCATDSTGSYRGVNRRSPSTRHT
jgi:hypothetical protein